MKRLIKETSDILEEYRKKRAEEGLDYNIFSLMGQEREEVKTHENMIFSILNYKTNLGLREKLKRQFLISMGLPKSFVNEKWIVEKEHYTTENGRLDLFFYTEGRRKKCVVVELKVDAEDGKRQIKRYEEYVLNQGYEDHRIVYLTLEGKEPSEQSEEGIEYPQKLLCRSFGEHLLNWLQACVEICQEYGVESSFIQQYKILIMKLVEDEKVEMYYHIYFD